MSWTIFVNYCQTVSSIFSVYLLGNTKKTNIRWLHSRLWSSGGTSLGGLWVIVVLVHGRRRAGHFSPHGELSVIVVLVNGLAVAELDGANHLVMMFQNRNQMPAPLLGCLIAVRLRLAARGPLPLALPTNATRTGFGRMGSFVMDGGTAL